MSESNEDKRNMLFESCRSLPMAEVKKLVEGVHFTTRDWVWIHKNCVTPLLTGSWYNLKVLALKKAIEAATTLEDWIVLAGYCGAPYRNRAFEEILKFDISSNADIDLLLRSHSTQLWAVGWYLKGRRKYISK